MESLKNELELFEARTYQKQIMCVDEVCINPYTSINSSPTIEFVIPGSDCYIDLSSMRLRIVIELETDDDNDDDDDGNENGNDDDDDAPSTVNNLIASIFSKVNLYLNSTLINAEAMNYSYKAYFETVLNWNSNWSSYLENHGFYFDTPDPESTKKAENSGYSARRELLRNRKKVELIGPLFVDFMRTHSKFLLSLVDIRVTLARESPNFYMWEKNNSNSNIKIHEANLFFNQISLSHDVYLAHHKILNTYNKRAIYPYYTNIVKSQLINSGIKSVILQGINTNNRLPRLVLISFVKHKIFTGDRQSNSFLFEHFNLSSIFLHINGKQIPGTVLNLDFSSKEQKYSRAYNTLYKDLNLIGTERTHMIDRNIFSNGQFILAFNLSADLYPTYTEISSPQTTGHIEIHCTFNEEINEPITCLMYLQYCAQIEIDAQRNIFIT